MNNTNDISTSAPTAPTLKNPIVEKPNASKSDYQKKMETQLKEWSSRLDTLKDKADKAGASAKAELHKTVDELKKHEEMAKKHLEELKAASVETWDKLKSVLEDKWTQLSASVEQSWSKIKA